MSKYKQIYTVKLRMAHYISYSLFDSVFTTWITVVILELIHATTPDFFEGMYLLDGNQCGVLSGFVVNHDNCANRMTLSRRWIIQVSALSALDGRVLAYHGFNG